MSDGFAVCWTTRDWTLRERLAALASFITIFERDGLTFAEQVLAKQDGDPIELGWTALGTDAGRFYKSVYGYS